MSSSAVSESVRESGKGHGKGDGNGGGEETVVATAHLQRLTSQAQRAHHYERCLRGETVCGVHLTTVD